MITTSDGSLRYALTPSDKLWAARMVKGEGGSGAAVLWTMAQRMALPPFNRGTFTELIRAYSQPINPIWQRDGSKCRPGGPYYGEAPCAESRLRRREQISSMTEAELGPQLELVNRWANGLVPNPVPRAVHFSELALAQRNCLANGSCRIVKTLGGNVHLSNASSYGWPADYVRVSGAGPGAAGGGGLGLALLAVAGGVAWAYYRSRS